MNKILKISIWPIILAPAIYLAVVWKKLPDKVAMHFNFSGTADRFGSKNELVGLAAFLIVLNIVVFLLVTNIHRIDPKKYAADNKSRLFNIAISVSLFLSFVLCLIIYTSVSGSMKFNSSFILVATALLFSCIGNYMQNLKPNYFAGIRLPWTLEDPENWRRTHALAGKLWFAGGILMALICLLSPPNIAGIIFFVIAAILVIVPCIYSFRLHLRHKIHNS